MAVAKETAQVENDRQVTRRVPEPQAGQNPELEEASRRLELARERLLSAAVAFCDGAISAGQLKAVREFLREQEVQLSQLTQKHIPPFTPPPGSSEPQDVEAEPAPVPEPEEAPALTADLLGKIDPEIADRLTALDRKMARLEHDLTQGQVNASQYQAIRRHYVQQREIAIKLHQANPQSDRWRVVLEEGKTSFLLQLNEAVCRGYALYDVRTRKRIFLQGVMDRGAEETMPLMGTFGAPVHRPGATRMLATQTEDGTALLLIPGQHTAALVMFSQDPPGWQVRAVREVHRNFEIANTAALARGERKALVFPDLSRIVKG